MWLPVRDGVLFPDSPQALLDQGQFHKDVDLIIGVCQTEGYLMSSFLVPNWAEGDVDEEAFRGVVKQQMTIKYPNQAELVEEVTTAFVKEYFDGTSGEETKKAVVEFIGDSILIIASLKTAEVLKGGYRSSWTHTTWQCSQIHTL